jgi:hypothetical protein
MHGTMKAAAPRWTEHVLGVCLCIVGFVAAHEARRAGMPQKWDAAIVGIVLPFYAVVIIKRSSWLRPTFWITLGACFTANSLLICIFFVLVLRDVTTFGWIWWVPVAFIETVALLHFQPKLERKFRAK